MFNVGDRVEVVTNNSDYSITIIGSQGIVTEVFENKVEVIWDYYPDNRNKAWLNSSFKVYKKDLQIIDKGVSPIIRKIQAMDKRFQERHNKPQIFTGKYTVKYESTPF